MTLRFLLKCSGLSGVGHGPPAGRGTARPAGRRCYRVAALGRPECYLSSLARTSRPERISRSSPSTVISVPPYLE